MRTSALWRGLFLFAVVVLCGFSPIGMSAQTTVNHPPIITSQAPTSVIAGATYQYTLTASDRDGNAISFRLTTAPDGMVLVNNMISWQPTPVGTYNAVIEANDGQSGYTSQAWQVTVQPAPVATIIIAPNDKPTVINIGNNQQFAASAYDQFSNTLATDGLVWSVEGSIGTIDQLGLFKAQKGGIGSVVATIGQAKAMIGVVVKDIRTSLVATAPANTNTTVTNQENATINKNTNANNNTNTNTTESISAGTDTDTSDTATEETKPCTNMAQWLITLLLILYPIILIIYYAYEKRHQSGSWWLFPFFLTVIGLIIYYKYFCNGSYLWWPWVLVGMGIVLTWWYKGRRHTNDFDTSEKLPF